ncbi:Protein of unknown function, partial [Nitratireductor indicus]|uniref:DUF2793 domain-containing protein n=1 Tax=Nitratireductor indicus TaxID=721133 RepID=UPI0008EF3B54
ATVRSEVAQGIVGVFDTPDLSGENFAIQPYAAIAVYGPDGDLVFYAYDADDTTTADDGGTTCIVVSGRRYKRSTELTVKDAVLSATTTAQPASPTLGDAYIVPAAPSGTDWASKAETVATFTARGWIFRQPYVGMVVYVEDEATFYHYNASGDWQQGLPPGALPDGSIVPMKLFEPFGILVVEDERNDPPGGTPTTGSLYQVGTSPTGAFVGHVGEIARFNGVSYDFIAASEGNTIYRKDASTLFSYRSGAWELTIATAVLKFFKMYGPSGNVAYAEGGTAILSATGLSGSVGDVWEIQIREAYIQTNLSQTGASTKFDIGIYFDGESSPRFVLVEITGTFDSLTSGSAREDSFYYISVDDVATHTISLKARRSSGGLASGSRIARATMNIRRLTPSA